MEPGDLTKRSLAELIELARRRELLDDWCQRDGIVHLRVGVVEVTLQEANARAYLRGLIRGNDLAHSRRGGA